MRTEYKRTHAVTGKKYSPMETPRFTEVPTFMRVPMAQNLDDLDIALVGLPYDGAVSNRPGARHGPREVRNQSSMGRATHHVTKVNPYDLCNVADVGDVLLTRSMDVVETFREIEDFYRHLSTAGVAPVTVGGDHSITYPILKGLEPSQALGLVHIDAHMDCWDVYMGSKYHHGSQVRRSIEDGLVDPHRTVMIGTRGPQNTTEGWDYVRENGIRVICIEEVEKIGVSATIEEALRVVGDGPAYLSFDVDGLDPIYAPGTGTPEIGGLTTREALEILRGLRALDLIGAEVTEVAPLLDPTGTTALTGASLMYEMLCLVAESFVARTSVDRSAR